MFELEVTLPESRHLEATFKKSERARRLGGPDGGRKLWARERRKT